MGNKVEFINLFGDGVWAGDLVAQLLTWSPDQRLTAEQTYMHPFLIRYMSSFPLTISEEQFEWQYEETLVQEEDVRRAMMNFINTRSKNVNGAGSLKDRKAFGGMYTRSRIALKGKNIHKMKNSRRRSNVTYV